MKNEYHISTQPGTETLIVREGQAPEVIEQCSVDVKGNINAPATWFNARKENIDLANCHVIVNKGDMSITLVIDENMTVNKTVSGKIKLDPYFSEFKINGESFSSPEALGDLIRRRQKFLSGSETEKAQIVANLRNWSIKIDKTMEKNVGDNKGNGKRFFQEQHVKDNLPDSFTIEMPIFEDGKTHKFLVDLIFNITDSSARITLESLEIEDIFKEELDQILEKEAGAFEGVPVIYV